MKYKLVPSNSSFGFVFVIQQNGVGGTNPKTYAVNTPTFAGNQFLLGATDDNVAGVTLGWPSDPGDNPTIQPPAAPTGRAYVADVSPNNIRLSQVSLQSIRMSHGLRAEPERTYLPTSFAYERNLAGGPAADAIIGDFKGCRRITVQVIAENGGEEPPVETVLVNGLALSGAPDSKLPNLHTFHLTNLGAIQVVNLNTQGTSVIGVHVELDL